MSFDFNILAVGQKQLSTFSNVSAIEIISELEDQLRYNVIWSFMTRTEGIWYNVGIIQNGLFSALPLLDAEFDSDIQTYPYWIEEKDDIKSDLVPLLVKPGYKNDFQNVLKTLVNDSPHGTVYLMARMQGGDEEVVCGVLSLDDFWELHDKKRILSNVCYVIKG